MAPDPTPQPPASQAPPKPETPTASATSEHQPHRRQVRRLRQREARHCPRRRFRCPIPVTPTGVPTFDGVREDRDPVRDRLGRNGTGRDTPEGKTAAQQFEARQKAAEEKLEIRASMHKSQD